MTACPKRPSVRHQRRRTEIGVTGATGAGAANGAWDVTVRTLSAGVTVDRTNPDDWKISEPSESTILDRDLSVVKRIDFIET